MTLSLITSRRAVCLAVLLALTGCGGSMASKPMQDAFLKKQESLLQADLAKAERAYSASRTQGADTLSTALFRLASNCLQQGRSAEAESLLRRCLQVGADEGNKPSAFELHWLALACINHAKL